jgi:hypothetical protein
MLPSYPTPPTPRIEVGSVSFHDERTVEDKHLVDEAAPRRCYLHLPVIPGVGKVVHERIAYYGSLGISSSHSFRRAIDLEPDSN